MFLFIFWIVNFGKFFIQSEVFPDFERVKNHRVGLFQLSKRRMFPHNPDFIAGILPRLIYNTYITLEREFVSRCNFH